MAADSTPVTAFLRRHEQMSAWLFFSFMAFMVMRYGIASGSLNMDMRYDYDTNIYYLIGFGWMHGALPYADLSDLKGPLTFLEHGLGSLLTPGSHGGAMLLHASVLGFWILYGLKTAALYVRRSTAWAIAGLFFFYTLQMCAEPAELVMALQQVSLYHVLVWSRGRKNCFCNRHLFIAGLGVAVALLTKFNLTVFWLPVIPLMLWCNRAHLVRGTAMVAAGVFLPLLPFILYFYQHGALSDLWQEYIQTAILYGTDTPFAASVLATKPFWLCSLLLPDLVTRLLPLGMAAGGGICLLSFWVIPALRGRIRRGRAVAAVMLASLLLGIAASFCGPVAHLHYSCYFYPYAWMSVVGIALLLHRAVGNQKVHSLLRAAGLLFPMLTLGLGLAIPLYVRLFKPAKGVAELRENIRGVGEMMEHPQAGFVVSDARHLTVIYRLAGKVPPLRHFVPQLVPGGEEAFRRELTEYIAARKPEYIISSTDDAMKAERCIQASGIPYERIDLQERDMPPLPPTSPYPAPVVYQRGG